MSTPHQDAPISPPLGFKMEADPNDPMRLRAVLDAGQAAADLARWAREVEEGRYTAELVRLGWTPPGAGAVPMTTPITPDERAEWRALADAATPGPWEAHEGTVGAMTGPRGCGGCSGLVSPRHEPACFWSEVAGAAPADAAFIAAARTAVPRLLDALDTAEARGRMAETNLTVAGRALGKALAEVARLRKEAARPAPVWDEDTVTEAVARAMFPHYFTDDRQPLRVFTETRSDAELREAERESARHRARRALAVVREHLPVKPDRETIARALRDAGLVEVEAVHEGYGAEEVVHAHLRPVVDAVLAEWPGESRATVQADALRDAGRWLVRIGYVGDFTFDTPAPDALWEAFVDAAHEDADGTMHGNTLTHTEVDDWLSEEARRPARTHADRLEKGETR